MWNTMVIISHCTFKSPFFSLHSTGLLCDPYNYSTSWSLVSHYWVTMILYFLNFSIISVGGGNDNNDNNIILVPLLLSLSLMLFVFLKQPNRSRQMAANHRLPRISAFLKEVFFFSSPPLHSACLWGNVGSLLK